jgi:hypothetical protein
MLLFQLSPSFDAFESFFGFKAVSYLKLGWLVQVKISFLAYTIGPIVN